MAYRLRVSCAAMAGAAETVGVAAAAEVVAALMKRSREEEEAEAWAQAWAQAWAGGSFPGLLPTARTTARCKSRPAAQVMSTMRMRVAGMSAVDLVALGVARATRLATRRPVTRPKRREPLRISRRVATHCHATRGSVAPTAEAVQEGKVAVAAGRMACSALLGAGLLLISRRRLPSPLCCSARVLMLACLARTAQVARQCGSRHTLVSAIMASHSPPAAV